MTESLKSSKDQYGSGLVIVADTLSRRFSAAKVDDMLKQQRMNLLVRKEFALAILEGRQRRLSIPKPADSG